MALRTQKNIEGHGIMTPHPELPSTNGAKKRIMADDGKMQLAPTSQVKQQGLLRMRECLPAPSCPCLLRRQRPLYRARLAPVTLLCKRAVKMSDVVGWELYEPPVRWGKGVLITEHCGVRRSGYCTLYSVHGSLTRPCEHKSSTIISSTKGCPLLRPGLLSWAAVAASGRYRLDSENGRVPDGAGGRDWPGHAPGSSWRGANKISDSKFRQAASVCGVLIIYHCAIIGAGLPLQNSTCLFFFCTCFLEGLSSYQRLPSAEFRARPVWRRPAVHFFRSPP